MAAEHITVILGNGSRSHFHGNAAYDLREGLLVVDTLEGATAHFNMRDYVLAYVTAPMGDDEERAILDAIEAAKAGEDDDDTNGSVFLL